MNAHTDHPRVTTGPPVTKEVLEEYLGQEIHAENWRDAIQTATILMPDFFGRRLDGHPESLSLASEKTETILREIYTETGWEGLRDQINGLLDKMDNVETMICLNLGNFFGIINDSVQNAWVLEYAVLIFMWQKLNEKKQAQCLGTGKEFSPIKKYFQDSSFDVRTKYLLREIDRISDPWPNIILEHHEADHMINDNTFVFAVHLPARASMDVLKLRPKAVVTNSSWAKHSGWERALVETFIEETLLTQNTEVGVQARLLIGVQEDITRCYHEIPVAPIPEDDHPFFATSIYLRKEELG